MAAAAFFRLAMPPTEHFDAPVAARTGLRIVTPREFLRLCGPPTGEVSGTGSSRGPV